MQYLGGKYRLSKKIIPILISNRTSSDQLYVEPFVGGCNVIDKIVGNRLANDSHRFLISMWKDLQRGWIPPDVVTKEQYYQIKQNKDLYLPSLVGFVGFACSFGGKWFGGYATNKRRDNFTGAGKRAVLKQISKMKDVIFSNKSYNELIIPSNSIIYCDPPYVNTTKYNKVSDFNTMEFWDWVRKMSKYNEVYVSEYIAPSDFDCVFSSKININLNKNNSHKRIEKLWKLHL